MSVFKSFKKKYHALYYLILYKEKKKAIEIMVIGFSFKIWNALEN